MREFATAIQIPDAPEQDSNLTDKVREIYDISVAIRSQISDISITLFGPAVEETREEPALRSVSEVLRHSSDTLGEALKRIVEIKARL